MLNNMIATRHLLPFASAFGRIWVCALLLTLLGLAPARAQQQQQGVCARVKIVILQELTLERIGFEATLEVTDNDGDDPITDFSAALTFENPALSTNSVNDASSLFFVRTPTLENLSSINGDGVIGATKKAVVRWFIIPKITAGGTSPDGVRYMIGCNLAGKLRGVDIPSDVMIAIPAPIYVKPEPQLDITYFQPRDVQGDDPFTPEVESPIPFTLGVLVRNSGYGTARKVKIDSQQPKIVENKQNLILVARLLGARVSDVPVQPTSLLVDIGDIPPGQARKGAWDMITSLSGEFIEFKASYTHASDLGGLETSVIKSLNAFFISHEVMNDQAGRDNLKDFLAITTNSANLIPDALYESEGNILPVNYLTNCTVNGGAGPGGSFTVTLVADKASWAYMRMDDPGQAKLPIAIVTRSDGKVLNTNNYWTNIRYTAPGNVKHTYLNIFDLVDLKTYTYTVNYAVTVADTTPPVTTMRFVGSVDESGGKYYITPDTQMYFTAEDTSPVSMFVSVTNGPFFPALPLWLPAPGEYPVAFYSTDTSGNREVTKTNILVVSGNSSLGFANVSASSQPLFVAGDALSIRPNSAVLNFQAGANPSSVNATVDIFQGVVAWATIGGTPSSPTRLNNAILTIGGNGVDYYRYQLNGGAWSAERPVASTVNLTNLTAGPQVVSVLGRSRFGNYMDATNATSVNWVVNPGGSPTTITGAPATPAKTNSATLAIGGTGVTAYRWTLNNGYYRAETNAPGTLVIPIASSSNLLYTVAVLGKTNGVFQPTNAPTTISWVYDLLYGYLQPGLPKVRAVNYTNIGTTAQSFTWDGRNNSGVALSPGWYTMRVTISDQLGRTNFATKVVQIAEVAGASSVVADVSRGPKNPYARGSWAVWQDQSDGSFQIYAQDLSVSNSPIVKLTTGALSQENPRTDGRYVVWQSRKANGNWDISMKDLASTNAVQSVTTTASTDEINPSIDWPWLVYQTRAISQPTAAWRLRAYNLATAQFATVSAGSQDQLDPDVQAGRVVWQDWRDVGPGEIYFQNLESGEARRITSNSFGQYKPVISGQWIVWQDNRSGQVDLYGFDLRRDLEVRLTSTPENETRPFIEGPWVVCQEDSLGTLTGNIRLLHLPSLNAVPITRTATAKDRPSLARGKAVWLDTQSNLSSVLTADLPSLQGVFENRNAVAITDAMLTYQQNAFGLLTLWHAQAGVTEITRYSSLVPSVVTQTAVWSNDVPSGANFALTPGSFVWVRFSGARMLDLGVNAIGPINLPSGGSVFSYSGFPGSYSAYRLLQQLGQSTVRSVRMLDAQSGRWVVASYQNGALVGNDFAISPVAVLMLDLILPVNNFTPQ